MQQSVQTPALPASRGLTLRELAFRNIQGKNRLPDRQPIIPPLKVKMEPVLPAFESPAPAVMPESEKASPPAWVQPYLDYIKSELGFTAVVSVSLVWNGLRAMRYGRFNRLQTDTVTVERMLKQGAIITLEIEERTSRQRHTAVLTASDFV